MKKVFVLLIVMIATFCGTVYASDAVSDDVIISGMPDNLIVKAPDTDMVYFLDNSQQIINEIEYYKANNSPRIQVGGFVFSEFGEGEFNEFYDVTYTYNETTDEFLKYPGWWGGQFYNNDDNLKLFVYPEKMERFLAELELSNPDRLYVIMERSRLVNGYILHIEKNDEIFLVPLLLTDTYFEFENRKKYTLKEFKSIFEAKPAKLVVFGKEVECDVSATIECGKPVIPLRALMEAMGIKVEWNEETRTVKFDRFDFIITEPYGDNPFEYRSYWNTYDENGNFLESNGRYYDVVNGRVMIKNSLLIGLTHYYNVITNVDRSDYTIYVERFNYYAGN